MSCGQLTSDRNQLDRRCRRDTSCNDSSGGQTSSSGAYTTSTGANAGCRTLGYSSLNSACNCKHRLKDDTGGSSRMLCSSRQVGSSTCSNDTDTRRGHCI